VANATRPSFELSASTTDRRAAAIAARLTRASSWLYSVSPGVAQIPAIPDVRVGAELDGDRQRRGDHGQAAVPVQRLSQFEGGGADVDDDRVPVVDQPRRRGADGGLGRARGRRPDRQRGLVGPADHGDRPAPDAAGEAVGLERLQVAPDRHLRDAELLGELGEPDLAVGGQPTQHRLPAL
jgi:hypothetical protein